MALIHIIFAFLYFPFHCTRLWQPLKRSLTQHDLVFLLVYLCLSDCPKPLPQSLYCRCISFSSVFLQPDHDHLPNFPLRLLLDSFSLKMEIWNHFFLRKHTNTKTTTQKYNWSLPSPSSLCTVITITEVFSHHFQLRSSLVWLSSSHLSRKMLSLECQVIVPSTKHTATYFILIPSIIILNFPVYVFK